MLHRRVALRAATVTRRAWTPASALPSACSSSVHACRTLSTYADPRDSAEAKRRKRQSNFWRQWGERSQQEFWQDVGFSRDRAKDELRSGVKDIRDRKAKGKASPEEEKQQKYDAKARSALEEDEYWDATDAFDEEGLGAEALEANAERIREHYWGTQGLGSRAGAERAERARAALLQDGELPGVRRAELMMLLEDAGPEGLLPPPPMPREAWLDEKQSGEFQLSEDLSTALVTTRNYSDLTALREGGMMPMGSYFAYLLNTRRVTKVTAEGKRQKFSVLVVVGNGQGTAGVGMGNDIEAGNALYKATLDARKNLVYVDRFEQRTLWYAINDRFARTKVVMRMRRPGSGTRCSWVVWKILSAFGISDCSVKIHGSKNPTTVSYVMVNALRRMMGATEIAERRGLNVLDMDPSEIRYPGYDGQVENKP